MHRALILSDAVSVVLCNRMIGLLCTRMCCSVSLIHFPSAYNRGFCSQVCLGWDGLDNEVVGDGWHMLRTALHFMQVVSKMFCSP
jgi:hypothetical protein